MKAGLFSLLEELAGACPYVSFAAVRSALGSSPLAAKPGLLRAYLSEAMEKKVIHDAGRGWYSSLVEPVVLDPSPVQELADSLRKAFPLMEFTVWSTTQLNPWMRHLFNHPLRFVSAPRENLDAVHELLRQNGEDSVLNPGKRDLTALVLTPRTVILRPAISKAPSEGVFATPEQVLVDLCIERKHLPLLDDAEFRQMAERMAFHNRLKMSRLVAYAKRKKVPIHEILQKRTLSPLFDEKWT